MGRVWDVVWTWVGRGWDVVSKTLNPPNPRPPLSLRTFTTRTIFFFFSCIPIIPKPHATYIPSQAVPGCPQPAPPSISENFRDFPVFIRARHFLSHPCSHFQPFL